MTRVLNRLSGHCLEPHRIAAIHVIERADETTALRQLDHPARHEGHHRLAAVFVMADVALGYPDGLREGGLREAKLCANGFNACAHSIILAPLVIYGKRRLLRYLIPALMIRHGKD